MLEVPTKLIPHIERERKNESFIDDLSELSSIESLSGNEGAIRNKLQGLLKDLELESSADSKGNLWVHSEDEKQGKILLCAHMDKVGPAKKIDLDGNKIVGRLDDALGLSIILQILRRGYRPSILFTVEEESQLEIENNGNTKLEDRELPDGIYNAGARYAASELYNNAEKPKLIIVVDVTQLGKISDGPIIYTSSGLQKPGKQFYFPTEQLKNTAKIINQDNPGVSYLQGKANDSIEFTFVPESGVIALEIPINNNHSNHEAADITDINKAISILEKILNKTDQI